jgi:hypothetical protein
MACSGESRLCLKLVEDCGSNPTLAPTHLRAAGLPELTAAHKSLEIQFAKLNMDRVPLRQALVILAERAHSSFDVRWDTLKSVGIMPTAPVTLHLSDVTVGRALMAVLAEVEQSRGHASFSVVNGVIIVNGNIPEIPESVTAVYNARDLIEMSRLDGTSRDEAVERLLHTLTSTIDSESWSDVGGRAGSIREASGLLVVTQTREGHAQVIRLLQQLRAADAERQKKPGVTFTEKPSGFFR